MMIITNLKCKQDKKIIIRYLLLSIALSSITFISSCAHQSQEASLIVDKEPTLEDQKRIDDATANQEENKKLCEDKQAIACMNYAIYLDRKLGNYKDAYNYYVQSFDLGYKKAGHSIGYFQIKHQEIFTTVNQPDIDKTIYYLEQAFEAGTTDAARQLMGVYLKPKHNILDYNKAEYYAKELVESNYPTSRAILAGIYLNHLKDTTKTELCIKLLNDELFEERTNLSAYLLAVIYLRADYSGTKANKIKALAYLYIARDLGSDSTAFELAEQEMTPEQIQQAKVLYKEIKAEMDAYDTVRLG